MSDFRNRQFKLETLLVALRSSVDNDQSGNFPLPGDALSLVMDMINETEEKLDALEIEWTSALNRR